MQFNPELWLRIRDKKVTAHQIRILAELAATHSQTRAAQNLGISVPVLHRHLKSMVKKIGKELVTTTPNGTWLTEGGRSLLNIYQRYSKMLEKTTGEFAVYCTPITYDLVINALLELELEGRKFRISVNSDRQNLKALYLGRAELVIFDDPMFAIEFEGLKDEKVITTDLFNDTLIHIDAGIEYVRYNYGAQRLGFRYLVSVDIPYKIVHEVSDYNYLISAKKSFFINKSFADRRKIKLSSATSDDVFNHPIMAVSIDPTAETTEVISRLKEDKKCG